MYIKKITLLVENGGSKLNKDHLDFLFKRIDDSEKIFKRISKVSLVNNSHRDFAVIYDLANVFLDGKDAD